MARILLTAGPTREPLDPVRYLSNASSGRTGLAIAEEALRRGHTVDLVLGPVDLPPPAGARVERVITCAEMLLACERLHPSCEALIGAAAVCDFRAAQPRAEKLRRGAGPLTLELLPNPDILSELAARKGRRVHAGFALETGSPAERLERARRKLLEKRLDWIVLNSPEALGAAGAAYQLLGPGDRTVDLGRVTKEELARCLLDAVEGSLKALPRGADRGHRLD